MLLTSDTSSVVSTLTTAFSNITSDMTSTITSILPIALGIVGTVMVVTFGIKLFKKFTGKA